jgi:hypothetical protein
MPYGFSYGYSKTMEGRICHVYLELGVQTRCVGKDIPCIFRAGGTK